MTAQTFYLRLRSDRLAPDYQAGDLLEVEPADDNHSQNVQPVKQETP